MSDRNAAGFVVQNRNGTAMMSAPTPALAQRAQPARQDSDRAANSISAAPSTTSDQNSAGSSTPTITGWVKIQAPSPILVKCAQRVLRCSAR